MRTFQRVARLIRPAIALPVLAALGLAGLMVLSQGCGPQKTFPMDTTFVNPGLPDVPVPTGTKFSTNDSYQRLTEGHRSVRHFYEVDWPLRDVSAFYRKHMPEFGWTMKEDTLSSGTQRFMFSKASDVCYISIWDNWGIKLLIQIMPMGLKSPEPVGRAAVAKPAGL
jgi:hypothetical protein